MIYAALHQIVEETNQFLMRRFSEQSTKAILGTLLNEAGVVPEENKNTMIFTLVNLEPDNVTPYTAVPTATSSHDFSRNVPFRFNLDVLVTASFKNYEEALKFLSETIIYIQAKRIFTHENSPGLDPGIDKLTVEIAKIDYHEMQSLWTAIGTNYRPSVRIKVGMLAFQTHDIEMSSTVGGIGIIHQNRDK